MKLSKIAVALIVSAVFVACCPCKLGKSKSQTALVGTNWQLTQIDGRTFNADNNFFFTLEPDSRVSGKGDCNRIRGSYTEVDGWLKFGQMASSRAFCPNQQQEDQFIKMLSEVNTYKIDGKILMLLKNGELVAMMEAVASEPKK